MIQPFSTGVGGLSTQRAFPPKPEAVDLAQGAHQSAAMVTFPWTSEAAAGLIATLLLALALDIAFGDPKRIYARIPHPAVLIGRLVDFGERHLNRESASRHRRIALGAFLTIGLVTIAGLTGWILHAAALALPFGWLLEALLASTLLAYRGLYQAVRAVAEGLDKSLEEGRRAVSEIVGRDPEELDESGVARAAAESAAENFSDGVVAPIFWFLLAGLPGIAAYKAINTLDSMIGHRSPRFEAFGKAAARLDDVVNWVPARFAALIVIAAASILPSARGISAIRIAFRDAGKHRSPNAGPVEAALAGALDLRLSGPRSYQGRRSDEPWIGDGVETMGATELKRVLDLYVAAGAVLLLGLAGIFAWLLR